MINKIDQLDTSVKVETIGVITGSIILIADIIILMNWGTLDIPVRNFFRGGNPGGIIVGVAAIVGFCSSLLFLINLLIGKRKYWGLRLFAVLLFLTIGAFIGNMD